MWAFDTRAPNPSSRATGGLHAVAHDARERPGHGLRVPVDDGEQHPRRPVGNAPAVCSLVKSARIETEAPGELPPAQPEPLPESRNPADGGIVDNPA